MRIKKLIHRAQTWASAFQVKWDWEKLALFKEKQAS